MTVDFVLHAGIHKTATTSLQELVFPRASNMAYTGKMRSIMALRDHETLQPLVLQLRENSGNLPQLSIHASLHYLAILQDYLVASIARERASLEELQPLLQLNRQLLRLLEAVHPNPAILYSCEGLLLSLGHIQPERCLDSTARFPLAYHELLFPGKVRHAIIYLRSPIEYLFSRYLQIHTIRCASGTPQDLTRVLTPAEYLDLCGRLWRGPCPSQSVFFHVFQQQLVASLHDLGLSVRARSYEQHICAAASISAEVRAAMGLQLFTPEVVDVDFKQKPLNTSGRDKSYATACLLEKLQLNSAAELKSLFRDTAAADPLVQEADTCRVDGG